MCVCACVCVTEQSDRVILIISELKKMLNIKQDLIRLYSHYLPSATSVVLSDIKYCLSLSMGYLCFGLIASISAFINRNEEGVIHCEKLFY